MPEKATPVNPPTPPAQSDKSLIARVRAGDDYAAAEFYHRYANRLFGLVRTQMGERLQTGVDPEDIVQSVFKSMFRGVQEKGYDATPGGTLWKLLAVLAVNKVRRRGRRDQELRHWASGAEDPLAIDFAEGRLCSEDVEQAILESIECLDEREQRVVLLRVRGFTVEKIGRQVGRSHRTVERMLRASRRRLSEELEICSRKRGMT